MREDSRFAVTRLTNSVCLDHGPIDYPALGVVIVPHLVQRARPAFDDGREAVRLRERREDLGAGIGGVQFGDDAVCSEPIVCRERLESGDGALEVCDEPSLMVSSV